MCKVYNTIGCLTNIKSDLHEQNIYDFKSVKELLNFQKNYTDLRNNIISEHKLLIEQEKKNLGVTIKQLNQLIETTKSDTEQKLGNKLNYLKQQFENLPSPNTVIKVYIYYFNKTILWFKIQHASLLFNFRVESNVKNLIITLSEKNNRFQYIDSSFENAVNQSCLNPLQELDHKKRTIDQIEKSILGAIGEQKVVKELEKLTDDYILINDFTYTFVPPLFNRQDNEYINSIQIDHLLITPSGIFLIETKNWSQNSLTNLRLRSPVQQIIRTSFAFYCLLNSIMSTSKFTLKKHHWGDRKIPIKNVIVLINNRPIESFKYIKIVTLNELLDYITYFEPCFSVKEVEMIAQNLLNCIKYNTDD